MAVLGLVALLLATAPAVDDVSGTIHWLDGQRVEGPRLVVTDRASDRCVEGIKAWCFDGVFTVQGLETEREYELNVWADGVEWVGALRDDMQVSLPLPTPHEPAQLTLHITDPEPQRGFPREYQLFELRSPTPGAASEREVPDEAGRIVFSGLDPLTQYELHFLVHGVVAKLGPWRPAKFEGELSITIPGASKLAAWQAEDASECLVIWSPTFTRVIGSVLVAPVALLPLDQAHPELVLPAGEYWLERAREGRVFAGPLRIELVAGETFELTDLAPSRGSGSVRARVVDGEGADYRACTALCLERLSGPAMAKALADMRGGSGRTFDCAHDTGFAVPTRVVELDGVAPGVYAGRARVPGNATRSRLVLVLPGVTTDVELSVD
jgi:hypothetical protein